MYVEKIEAVTDADRALCAAFKKAKGMAADAPMKSCGLGWATEYAENEGGMSKEEAFAFYQRLYFDAYKDQALVFTVLTEAGIPLKAADLTAKLEMHGLTAREARIAAQTAIDDGGIAMLDKDMKWRLMGRGDRKFVMG